MPRRLPATREQSEGSAAYAIPGLSDLKGVMGGGKEVFELVISEGHPRPYRAGGPFYQVHRWYRLREKTDQVNMKGPRIWGNQWRCNGPVLFNGVTGLSLPPTVGVATISSYADPYGAVGWNRTRPTREVASALVAAGELIRDGIPSAPGVIIRDAARRARSYATLKENGLRYNSKPRSIARALGSEYLNYDFGWRPMVDDAMKLMEAATGIAERLQRWRQQGNGRTLRRSMVLKDSTTTSSTVQNTNVGGWLTCGSLGAWNGSMTTEYKTHDKVWYSAGYRLNIPDLNVPYHYYRTMAGLLGASPSVDVVWRLTPWSWLAGWASNLNHVVANTFDPLSDYFAAAYAFTMHRREVSMTKTVIGYQASTYYGGPFTVTVGGSSGVITKYRKAASPFGFGSTWDGLSASQVATAAALGISRT